MRRQAFTIIELLIVIVIIGILITGVVVGYNSHIERSVCTRIREDFYAIEQAAQTHYEVTGSWADEVDPGEEPAFVPEYLREWPSGEFYDDGYDYDWKNWAWAGINFYAISLELNNNQMAYYYCVQDDRTDRNDCRFADDVDIQTEPALNRDGECPAP